MKKLWLSLILAIGLILPIAHSPVNHIPVFTPTVAYSATGYIDPNGDGATLQWTSTAGATHYTTIDDGIRQPTAGDKTDYVGVAPPIASGTKVDVFDMSTIDIGGETVTNITVLGYGVIGGTGPKVKITGATLTSFGFTTADTWKSVSFDVTWTQTDLDNMQITISQVHTQFSTAVSLWSMYAVVTYTGGGGGAVTKSRGYIIQ